MRIVPLQPRPLPQVGDLVTFAPVFRIRIKTMIELNPVRFQIADLSERLRVLRGYL